MGSPPPGGISEGPLATEELLQQVAESGLGLLGYSRALIVETGINLRGHLAQEPKIHLHGLYLMSCVDRLNTTQLATAEHMSRRVLQLLEAAARNAKAPDFDHLEGYLLHMAEPGTTARADKFAAHIAGRQQIHTTIMKQRRLAK